MRVIWMEISDLKSTVMLLIRYYTVQKSKGLSNEILSISAAQGAAKLQEVKVGSLEKKMKTYPTTQLT